MEILAMVSNSAVHLCPLPNATGDQSSSCLLHVPKPNALSLQQIQVWLGAVSLSWAAGGRGARDEEQQRLLQTLPKHMEIHQGPASSDAAYSFHICHDK